MVKPCGWCREPFAPGRRDAIYCRKACRQAAHRAGIRRVTLDRAATPLRLAYADPPYPGKARIYRDHPDFAGEVDHTDLLLQLTGYDGWALSTSAEALPAVLAEASRLEARRIRVATWVKPRPVPHPSARLLNAWEPVLFVPARELPGGPQVVDVLAGVASRRRSTLPRAVVGMKPPAFCAWVWLRWTGPVAEPMGLGL